MDCVAVKSISIVERGSVSPRRQDGRSETSFISPLGRPCVDIFVAENGIGDGYPKMPLHIAHETGCHFTLLRQSPSHRPRTSTVTSTAMLVHFCARWPRKSPRSPQWEPAQNLWLPQAFLVYVG